jgi:hypothetical protein
MAHVQTLSQMQAYYTFNKDRILNPNYRYAVVLTHSHSLFKTTRGLHSRYPCFKENAEPTYGTPPMLIDIGRELNSPQYRREQLKLNEIDWNLRFVELMNRHEKLSIEKASLETRVK